MPLYEKEQELDLALRQNTANSQMLEKLVSLPQPQNVDAAVWINAAQILGAEAARLQTDKEKLDRQKRGVEKRFARQTQSHMPLHMGMPCKGAVELTLPYGYVTFDTAYEAKLQEGKVAITQKLVLNNRSGIEIEVDSAHFYYRSAQAYVSPVHFSPWVVGEARVLMSTKNITRTMEKRKMNDAVEEMAVVAPVPMKATYEDAREYTVSHLKLPSTGEPKEVPVMTWRAPLECKEELFAYHNTHVFNVCSFVPKFQIEKNQWKIWKEGKLLNENAVGEYLQDRYRLYTQIDRDIKVTRKRIVQKDRQSGIFGDTVRKKDGFALTLVNKSNKQKSVAVTERIPTSNTEKIKVKLISVTGSKPVHYQLMKEGKLKIDVSLAPKETEKIKVVFEITYDEDLKIDY